MTTGKLEPIPMWLPHIGPEVIRAATEALEVGYLGLGKATREFEEALERYLELAGDRVLMSTNSCTAALNCACLLAGAGPGDEVIAPSFTYVAAHQAVTATGAEVVFCDIEEPTLTADPDAVRELIGERTKAIMVCHFAGLVGRLDEIYQIAAEHGLRVIEDAAHALGTRHAGRLVGATGDLVCFSFGPVKTMTTLEGGAIVTPNPEELQVLHQLRLLGVDRETEARYQNRRAWEYDVLRQGFRYHLGAIPAAIGLAQLALLDQFVRNRQEYCRGYNERLAGIPEVITPDSDYKDVAPFIYFIRVPAEARQDLIDFLKERGVPTGIHFLGAHEFTFYRNARRGDLSVTDRVAREELTLPLWSYMDDAVLDRVADGVTRFFS
ncbi:MAG TPA: DegT/DnrJ/EryC1/StrS family aminotransferase [Actinomycetes bacterium]|jgi:dTDP-4-amino-4,6-dideoxygalactose transaminase|nr:DegT/DnrJ/EryC1/StrS family aminotransferase [Actinomycetes bacterium]